jgi:hypothetical protein
VSEPKFRRPKPGEIPTSGGDDELLDEPPPGVPSSLSAYRQGSRVRRWVLGGLVVGALAAGIAAKAYVDHLEEQRRIPDVDYQLADGTENEERSRVMEWSEGQARLGLSREPPGVEAIVLPDRVLRLAEGHDHAQVKVHVEDGETVSLKVIVGEIVQEPPPASQ